MEIRTMTETEENIAYFEVFGSFIDNLYPLGKSTKNIREIVSFLYNFKSEYENVNFFYFGSHMYTIKVENLNSYLRVSFISHKTTRISASIHLEFIEDIEEAISLMESLCKYAEANTNHHIIKTGNVKSTLERLQESNKKLKDKLDEIDGKN